MRDFTWSHSQKKAARQAFDDDIEGAAAKMSFLRTIVEGMIFQPKIMIWVARRHWREHPIAIVEIILVMLWLGFCFSSLRWTPIFGVYAILMIMGSWIIPLITSY